VSTTTSDTFQTKISATTASVPAGTYRVAVTYGWNHDSTGSDFEARLMVNSSQEGELHKQEPQDSAGSFSTTFSSQRYYVTRVFYVSLSAGTHDLDLEYRTDLSGDESSIWNAVIEFWRVQ